jgi:hypothetical protein
MSLNATRAVDFKLIWAANSCCTSGHDLVYSRIMQITVKIFKAIMLFSVLRKDLFRFSPWGKNDWVCLRTNYWGEYLDFGIYWRKSQSVEFLKLHSSHSIGRAIKPTVMTWTGHVVCTDILTRMRDTRFLHNDPQIIFVIPERTEFAYWVFSFTSLYRYTCILHGGRQIFSLVR